MLLGAPVLTPEQTRLIPASPMLSKLRSPGGFGQPHLLLGGLCLRLRGLRGVTVRAASPGARSRFPEVSVHALGWMFCRVRVGGCGSDSLAPRGVWSFFMNEKFFGLNHLHHGGWGRVAAAPFTSQGIHLSRRTSVDRSARNFTTPGSGGKPPLLGKSERLGVP